MRFLANGEGPDQGLDCLLWQKQSSMKIIHFYVVIIAYDFSVYTLIYPKFIASNQMDKKG